MEDQIITEQIDVVVIGDRKLQLVALMLDRELLPQEPKHNLTHQKYLEMLGKLVGDPIIPESPKKNYSPYTPYKFTKVVLTNSFWLHIHFFVHDNKIFDPFISQSCRGSVSICIIASSDTDLTAAKAYLLQQTSIRPLQVPKKGGIVPPERIIEAQIMATAHEISVGGFPAVLALKITQEKRIVEESSNLRLTVNQIARWIVQRHFEAKHRIKINPKLGDQIEYFEQKQERHACSLI